MLGRLVLGAAVTLAMLAFVGSASAKVIGTARSSGYGALAEATVTTTQPNSIAVRVLASPRQTVTVRWETNCARGFSGASVSGHFTGHAPLTRKIEIALPGALACIVVANSQLTGGGSIVMQLLAS
jgi:hypothetical protein